MKNYADWSPEMRDIITATDGPLERRSLYMLPIGSRWKHKPGLTLLGDAAHLMTPFGGEGVNLAFQDSLSLGNAIIDAAKEGKESSLDARIREYEEDMFERALKAQKMSDARKHDMLFTPGAPRTSIVRWLLRKVEYNLPSYSRRFIYPLMSAGLNIFFFFYKFFV